jgi:membrane protease subunit HflK
MNGSGDFDGGRILAMAKGKGPWSEGEGANNPDPPPVADGTEAPEAPPTKGEEPPRNPWLPPHEDEQQRRSANIEDIFRQRAARRPGGSAPNGGQRNWLPLVLGAMAAAWIGGTSVHVLSRGEQGLVTTLGQYDRTVGPGLTLSLPWPAQSVSVRNTAKFEETLLPAAEGENLMLTRDRQLVDLGIKLRWRITDLRRFAYGAPDTAALVAKTAQAQVLAATAEQPFDGLIDGQRRPELAQRITARSQRVFDALGLGVRIESAEVTRANPPARLAEAFRKVGLARQESRKAVSKAQIFAQEALEGASNEAAEFESVYLQYQAAPEITRKRRYYETMERVLSRNPVVVMAGNGATATVSSGTAKAAAPASATGGQ